MNYVKLENLNKFDTCKKRIITVEPDIYINNNIHTRVFIRDEFFGCKINSFNVEIIPAIISPSLFSSRDTFDNYTEILVEPLQHISQNTGEEFVFVMEESAYYMSNDLFEFIFGREKVDILNDSSF